MHARILGVAVAAIGATALAATDDGAREAKPRCPRASAVVIERFISAQCEACWIDASVTRPEANQWLLDWIVPSARGDDAPLSSAAPAEASERAHRVLTADVAPDRTSVQRSAARSGPQMHLRVVSGPAWSGYFGVQLDGRGHSAPGASAWIALVESVDVGTDGSAVPRQLVRTVAGPFMPTELRGGKPWRLLQAMRWPETAKPARLQARAWIEDAAGRIVAMAGEGCDAH
jgi:hypothetical protein